MNIYEPTPIEPGTLRDQRLMAVGTLAAGAAHDLNNLFTSLRSFTHLLNEKVQEPKLLNYIHLIERILDRATEMTNGILRTVREEDEAVEPQDPLRCIRDVSSLVRRTLPNQMVLILSMPQTSYPVKVRQTELTQVLLNLLINARDALSGHGVIKVAACFDPAEDPTHLQLSVTDNGCGIPEADVERIFEPFYTTKRTTGGTGLGLSVVRRLVERADGTIAVQSRPGETVFVVKLPVHR